MTASKPPQPPYPYTKRLTGYVTLWQNYLVHTDHAARMKGLRAMREYVEALIYEEERLPLLATDAAPQPESVWRRILTQLQRYSA